MAHDLVTISKCANSWNWLERTSMSVVGELFDLSLCSYFILSIKLQGLIWHCDVHHLNGGSQTV
jgi:hypothetical protein